MDMDQGNIPQDRQGREGAQGPTDSGAAQDSGAARGSGAAQDSGPADRPAAGLGQRITDPARIRALAHPVRLDLLEFLDDALEATATECAAHTGETVANCSFHLRTLAKAGFIEPAPQRGREKPWRPVSRERSMDIDPDDPASLRAVGELVGLTVLREAERVRDFMARQTSRPAGWEDTVTVTSQSFWATADELRELVETVHRLTERFAGRSQDPDQRPAGAVHSRLFATVNPDEFATRAGEQ